jgi:hypothetical protein
MTEPAAQHGRTSKGPVILAALCVVLLEALYWIPPIPRSVRGWLTLLLIAPPLYVAGEWLADRVNRPRWESSAGGKVLKATLIIVVVLLILMVAALIGAV